MVDVPAAIHVGADELPFVDIGDGSRLKVIQVKEAEGLWIVENVFNAGYEVQQHEQTGQVYAYKTSGAWKYKNTTTSTALARSCTSRRGRSTPCSRSRTTPTCGSRCTART